jgi:hypothetical protein
MYMAISVKEVGTVWVLKDMLFTTYEEGEDLIHEAAYGLFTSNESARRAAAELEHSNANFPRGKWVVYDEIVYE